MKLTVKEHQYPFVAMGLKVTDHLEIKASKNVMMETISVVMAAHQHVKLSMAGHVLPLEPNGVFLAYTNAEMENSKPHPTKSEWMLAEIQL